MSLFRENPFWGAFIAIAGGALLVALGLVWWTKSSFEDAMASYQDSATEQTRLESGNPYPSRANVAKMKTYLDEYKATLDKLKTELKTHMLPEAPLAPNEFQTRLRQAIGAVAENARSHRVKLPANFNLGFDEFVSALPSPEDAPALGQELAQIQLLLNTIIEARVDAITAFRRVPQSVAASSASPAAAATPPRGAQKPPAKLIEQRTVEFSLSAPPSAGRKVINQISTANDQFFIIRAVYIKNQKDKGPARENPTGTTTGAPSIPPVGVAPGPAATPAGPLNFIVGNEHIDLSARVELVNFRL
ncbi:MAG: hypothetical protein DME38_01605 [Verrucomicrobia bacterium]|nr:MAG: hypothetical protein DME38_01605 [Verrucomicrobiota bacterium]